MQFPPVCTISALYLLGETQQVNLNVMNSMVIGWAMYVL